MTRPPCRKCGDRPCRKERPTCWRCSYRDDGKTTTRELCEKCGVRPRQDRGRGTYYTVCWKCRRPDLATNWRGRKCLVAKLNHDGPLVCSRCGFVPQHPSQIDVDHVDGDRHNNDPVNHQLLCANCHRLKTIENGDHLRRYDVDTTL